MASNQVTVATPGPAGATGLVYEGLWVTSSVYQVRDLVRFTDGNLYVCNVQHTASGSNTPILDSTTWTLFINADDAFQWATKAKHTSITDSIGNTGYSALHQQLQPPEEPLRSGLLLQVDTLIRQNILQRNTPLELQ